jgi:hypothetical protein
VHFVFIWYIFSCFWYHVPKEKSGNPVYVPLAARFFIEIFCTELQRIERAPPFDIINMENQRLAVSCQKGEI